MEFRILVSWCLFNIVLALDVEHAGSNKRESRKLFGGYRITPRQCIATRKPEQPTGGPNVCMFNHECLQRDGQVVGACMDGFLFGACCQLPSGTVIGDFIDSDLISVGSVENNLSTKPALSTAIVTKRPQTTPVVDITSSGVSQITAALLNPSLLPTAQDNAVVQVSNEQSYFTTTGVTHPHAPDTVLLNQLDNEIDPGYFIPTTPQAMEDRKTTMRSEETTMPYPNSPIVHISLSNAPIDYSPTPGFHRPMFRPKPSSPSNPDQYVLVPTITHETIKPNKTQEYDSIVNIIHMLNSTSTGKPQTNKHSTTNRPPSTSYVFSTTSTKRPGSGSSQITSLKPPSTSYIFSTTIPPRRTEVPTTTKKKPSSTKKPTKRRPTIVTKIPSTGSLAFHSTPSKTTVANSAAAFVTTQRPPTTSYVFSSVPTRRPPSTVNTHIAGPAFSVTSTPGLLSSTQGQFSNYPSPAPTLIVLGPVTDNEIEPSGAPSTYQQHPVTIHRPTAIPQRKPINQVTINNHVTQNIYSTSEKPSPTVLITPKPSSLSSSKPPDSSDTVEVGASAGSSDDLVNFPPVRNPNLNMSSITALNENDITTPAFIEDEELNANVESFVNKIIQGLQEPFQGLKDVVYNRNNATVLLSSSSTTKKPVKKQGTTTKKPVKASTAKPTKPTTSSNIRPATSPRPTVRPVTTRKPTTRRPATTVPSKKQPTTTKRTKTTRKPVTTTQSLIDHQTEDTAIDNEDYRTQCGVRPLMKRGRIVGGKGATFGEFPWQVLVRESTWLGLFTKNKCGGVLISHKYVMTAAHCQPGFLASLVAVFGEFDISKDLESKRSISRNVKRVIVHRQYDAATFENDLALLELEQPVQFDIHIIPICLPRDGEDFTGRMAIVTGWGRLRYGGGVPSVLQEVQVPIMENPVCQQMFRLAGHSKLILDSFLCAGYTNGQKDACEGDSGGPLVLQRPDGRYQLAGTVSHGIKCAEPYLPGVYMRTQYYKPWITSITGVTSP